MVDAAALCDHVDRCHNTMFHALYELAPTSQERNNFERIIEEQVLPFMQKYDKIRQIVKKKEAEKRQRLLGKKWKAVKAMKAMKRVKARMKTMKAVTAKKRGVKTCMKSMKSMEAVNAALKNARLKAMKATKLWTCKA